MNEFNELKKKLEKDVLKVIKRNNIIVSYCDSEERHELFLKIEKMMLDYYGFTKTGKCMIDDWLLTMTIQKVIEELPKENGQKVNQYDYSYPAAVEKDVLQFINKNNIDVSYHNGIEKNELVNKLHDMMWCCDEVTGNGGHGYTSTTWQAERYLSHNLDLLPEALEYLGYTRIEVLKYDVIFLDSMVRCLFLDSTIRTVVTQLAKKGGYNHE